MKFGNWWKQNNNWYRDLLGQPHAYMRGNVEYNGQYFIAIHSNGQIIFSPNLSNLLSFSLSHKYDTVQQAKQAVDQCINKLEKLSPFI